MESSLIVLQTVIATAHHTSRVASMAFVTLSRGYGVELLTPGLVNAVFLPSGDAMLMKHLYGRISIKHPLKELGLAKVP